MIELNQLINLIDYYVYKVTPQEFGKSIIFYTQFIIH